MRLLADADNTLIIQGGKLDGEPRQRVVALVRLYAEIGWSIYVWSHGGTEHAWDVVGLAGLRDVIPRSHCTDKPQHPYTDEQVRLSLGFVPDLQFDDLETEAIPGVHFIHTPRDDAEADQYADEAMAGEEHVAERPRQTKPSRLGEKRIVKRGDKWCVLAEDTDRSFGCYDTRHEAHVRLGQIEYFRDHPDKAASRQTENFRRLALKSFGDPGNTQERAEGGRFGAAQSDAEKPEVAGAGHTGFGPQAAEYPASWSELPDTVYHVAPADARQSIAENGLQPQGHAWNFALSQNDVAQGGHWDPEAQVYHGAGSDTFGWRPEAVYVFADKASAADFVTYAEDKYGRSFDAYAIDARGLENMSPIERPDVIKDPEQIQQANEDAEESDSTPESPDEVFDRLSSEDYGEGERDYRQWAIEQVPPEYAQRLEGYDLKPEEDWSSEDYEAYAEAHPEEFADEEEAQSVKRLTLEQALVLAEGLAFKSFGDPGSTQERVEGGRFGPAEGNPEKPTAESRAEARGLLGPLANYNIEYSEVRGFQTFHYLNVKDEGGQELAHLSYHPNEDGYNAIDGVYVDPSLRGQGVAVAMDAALFLHEGLPIEHGSFSSVNGIGQAVYMASHYSDWNRLWLSSDAAGDHYWKPGTPIPSDTMSFDPLPFGTPDTIQETIARAQKSLDPREWDRKSFGDPGNTQTQDERGRFGPAQSDAGKPESSTEKPGFVVGSGVDKLGVTIREGDSVLTPDRGIGTVIQTTHDYTGQAWVSVQTEGQGIGAGHPYVPTDLEHREMPATDKRGADLHVGDRVWAGDMSPVTITDIHMSLSGPMVRLDVGGGRTGGFFAHDVVSVTITPQVGDTVVSSGGDIGTLRHMDAESDHATIELADGRYLADSLSATQWAGTWETPEGWIAAGVWQNDRGLEVQREVYTAAPTDDKNAIGLDRIYSIQYQAPLSADGMVPVQEARACLAEMVDRNVTLEKDSDLTNAWNGKLEVGIADRERSQGADGVKNWDCSIAFDRAELFAAAVGRNPGEMEGQRSVSEGGRFSLEDHELAHGLSASTDVSNAPSAYRTTPGLEEGVVQGYVESLAQVGKAGEDGSLMSTQVPGMGAYSHWVSGLDAALSYKVGITTGWTTTGAPAFEMSVGQRLDFYRELIQTPLGDRQAKLDEMTLASGHQVVLIGKGLGSDMSYGVYGTESGMREHEKSAPKNDSASLIAAIFRTETPEQARKLLERVRDSLTAHYDFDLARAGEALLMFATCDQPVKKRESLPVESARKRLPRYTVRPKSFGDPGNTQEQVERGRFGPAQGTEGSGAEGEKIVGVLSVVDTREWDDNRDPPAPIRGSGDPHQCDRCGKDHEVHVTVRLANGSEAVIGSGCARQDEMSMVRQAVSSATTVERVGRQLAVAQVELAVARDAWTQVQTAPLPAVETGERGTIGTEFTMGEQSVYQHDEGPINEERLRTLTDSWQEAQLREALGATHGNPLLDASNMVEGLQQQYDRAQRSYARATESNQPKRLPRYQVKFSEDQPRNERGEWTAAEAEVLADEIIRQLEEAGIVHNDAPAGRVLTDEARTEAILRGLRRAGVGKGLKYSEDQERDERGRWTAGGGGASAPAEPCAVCGATGGHLASCAVTTPSAYDSWPMVTAPSGWTPGGTLEATDAARLAEQAVAGGFSFNVLTATEPTTGFMCGGIVEPVVTPVDDEEACAHAIVGFVDAHGADLARDPNLYIGGWVSGGNLVIELSENIPSREDAVGSGQERNQESIYDVTGKTEIGTGGTGEYRPGTFQGTGRTEVRSATYRVVKHDARAETQLGADLRALLETGDGEEVERKRAILLEGLRSGRLHVKYSEDQERDERGRWTDGGGGAGEAEAEKPSGTGSGTDAEHPFVTTSVDDACRALAEGKYVDLHQERGPSTLLDKLAEIGRDAQARGQQAPVYDLGKVTIRGTNIFMNGSLGVPRADMPQFTGVPTPGSPADAFPKDAEGKVDLGQAFIEHLQETGVSVTNERTPADCLRATQSELSGTPVASIAQSFANGTLEPTSRMIWTTQDDYVLDGHHWWAAAVGASYMDDDPRGMSVATHVIDLPITDALREAQKWTADMGINPRAVGKRLRYRAVKSFGDPGSTQERVEGGRFGPAQGEAEPKA